MSISVIIPTFNEEKYIGSTIERLLEQTVKPDEIIVVDNNSTDSTREILKNYPVKVVEEKKQGMIYARDKGFDEARGDILARTDADTEVSLNWVERILHDFETFDIVAVSGPAEYGSGLFTWITKLYFIYNRLQLPHEILYGPNMAITKKLWGKIHDQVCTDDRLVHEDIDLAIHGAQHGKILYDSKLIVKTSARRVKNPGSFLFDYIPRWKTTIKQHPYL